MIRVSNLHPLEVNFLAQEIKRNLLAFNFTIQEIKRNLLRFNFTIQEIKHEPLAFDFMIPYSVPQSVGGSKKDIDQPYIQQAHVANRTCNVNFPPTAPRYMDSIGKVHHGRALWKYYFFQAQNSTNQEKSFHLRHQTNQYRHKNHPFQPP